MKKQTSKNVFVLEHRQLPQSDVTVKNLSQNHGTITARI